MNVTPVVAPVQSVAQVQQANSSVTANSTFKDIFDSALQNLNDSQLNVEQTAKKFLTGEIQDVHTVVIAMEEAKLSMQLAVEVRNKIVEAYQEISRMQV